MRRFDVYLTNLEPAYGREMKKIRPTLIVSPDEMNQYCGTEPRCQAVRAATTTSHSMM
jgi:mRNA-degrading endonuclease toxin of MazEF toxin-antitoxin module